MTINSRALNLMDTPLTLWSVRGASNYTWLTNALSTHDPKLLIFMCILPIYYLLYYYIHEKTVNPLLNQWLKAVNIWLYGNSSQSSAFFMLIYNNHRTNEYYFDHKWISFITSTPLRMLGSSLTGEGSQMPFLYPLLLYCSCMNKNFNNAVTSG